MTEQMRNCRVPVRGRCRLLAVGLVGGSLLMAAAVPLTAQGPPADVEIGITPQSRVFDAADGLRFRVTLRNTGAKALLLNGGLLLGNGRQAWQAITCALHPKTGAQIRLDLHWQVGPVGGRIYFLGVPLRPGDAHTLAVTAPPAVRGLHDELLKLSGDVLPVTAEVLVLMQAYERRKILPKRYTADMTHIALATVAAVDAVVSWNFKHIVRLEKIRLFNAVNVELGYRALSILSPREVATYEGP